MNRRRFLTLLGLGGVGGAAGAIASADRAPQEQRTTLEKVKPASAGHQRIVWSVDDAPGVALTFDDGPDPDLTPRILDILDRFKVPATFFSMGYNAALHPRTLRDVVAAGHEVGSHGWRHLNLTETSLEETRREIEVGTSLVEKNAGVTVRTFRPPYGRFGEEAVRALATRAEDMVIWSVARGQLRWRDPQQVAGHILGSLQPGAIVDLHDGIGRGTFNPGSDGARRIQRRREVELEALPLILQRATDKGTRFVTVSELISSAPSAQKT